MTNTIGRVDFLASVRGDNMERDARREGEKAGEAGADGYTKKFRKGADGGFRQMLTENGKRSYDAWARAGKRDSNVYAAAFREREKNFSAFAARIVANARRNFEGLRLDPHFMDDFSQQFEKSEHAVRSMREQLDALDGTVNRTALNAAKRQVDVWDKTNRQREATEKLENAIARLGKGLDRNSVKWKNLSANTRQWTLIITAVAAAAEDIAVLGSAAGAGLIAVGGGVAALGVAAVGVGAIVANLFQDIKDAPASMRPTIREFLNLRESIGDMNDVIAQAAFKQMGGAFDDIRNTLRGLTPALALMGTTLGRLTRSFADAIKPGTEGFQQINRLVLNASPLVDTMARSAGTLGIALVRAFNNANPLVQKMVGWVDTLIQRFNDFTQGPGFDVWIGNATRVFTSFGKLLDATGRALNNLVTPDSVDRTTQFIDRLTSFMPNLTSMLNALGALDVFGVLAAGLDDLGKALAPILPAVEDLAGALRGQMIVYLDAFGASAKVVAEVTAPLVQILANFIKAIPAPVIQGIAVAVTALGVAFAGLKVAGAVGAITKSIGTGVTYLGLYATNLGEVGSAAKGMVGKLTGVAGKAGIFGLVATAAIAGAAALKQWGDAILDYQGKATEAVGSSKSLVDSIHEIGKATTIGQEGFTAMELSSANLNDAMKFLADSGGTQWGMMMNFGTKATEETQRAAEALRGGLEELQKPLASLAENNLPAAQKKFSDYTAGLNLSDQALYNIIHGTMGDYEKALIAQIKAQGNVATQTNIVNAALGRHSKAQNDAEAAAKANQSALDGLMGQEKSTTKATDDLANAIRGFGSKTLDSREAARQFQSAIADATKTIDENTKSTDKNKRTLDISTAAGRDNQAALDGIAKAALNAAASKYEQTQNENDATAAINAGRKALIEQLAKFGITGKAAEKYADNLGLIPSNITTAAKLTGVPAAESALDRLARDRTATIHVRQTGQTQMQGNNNARFASGGTLHGPRYILAGEAGPEAIVPLRRPLNQVDPSVRWLSAIAQGRKAPAMASGGVVGGGKTTNVEAGAIVVQGSLDPYRTANDVVNRLYEETYG